MRLRCLITAFAAFSVYQVQGSCERALGMNNGRIKDKQITSPSARDNKHMPHHARKGHSSSWCSAAQNFSYIQVALGGAHVIRAVTIEGGGVKTLMWVAHYTISYRSYGAWRWYQENGKKKILVGVKKFNDHKKSLLNNVIADVIRVHPQNVSGVSPSSSEIEHACLRLELYGCPAHGCQAPVIPIGAVLVQLIQYRMPLHGAMAIFACKGGLYLRGIPIQHCRSGRWSNATFECIAPCVDSFKPKQNERIEYGFKNGIREARFVCNKGHIMERGNKTLRCVQGKWIGIRPVCRAPCSDPGYLVHGTRHGNDFTHNKTVTFQCINGYKMNGSSSLTCNDGTWSSSVPTCEAPTCSAPVLYPNSRIIYPPNWMTSRFKYGDVVVYMCAVGDQVGDSSSTCNNGVWTSRKYQCVVPCTAPSKQQGRKVIGIDYRHGKSIQFECDFGYNLMGNKQIWCKRGRWSHPLPNCKASCPSPPRVTGRIVRGNDFSHGQSISFSCDRDYVMFGRRTIRCSNGQWSDRFPDCNDCIGVGAAVLGLWEKARTGVNVYVKASVTNLLWWGRKLRMKTNYRRYSSTKNFLKFNYNPLSIIIDQIPNQGDLTPNTRVVALYTTDNIRFFPGKISYYSRRLNKYRISYDDGDKADMEREKIRLLVAPSVSFC